MRQIDFAPLYRSTVGFDRLFDMLDGASGFDAGAAAYPPYNIERLGENEYRITMAVAGFSEDELKIDVKEQTLNVRGEKKAEEQGAPVPAPRHRHPRVRPTLPPRRPCRGEGRGPQGRPAPRRPRAQRARAAEAAHRCHQQRQGGQASRAGRGQREVTVVAPCRLQEWAPRIAAPISSCSTCVAHDTTGRDQLQPLVLGQHGDAGVAGLGELGAGVGCRRRRSRSSSTRSRPPWRPAARPAPWPRRASSSPACR